MANLPIKHREVMKWLLRYLRGTSDMVFCFMKNSVTLQDFVDANLGGDMDYRKSTGGYVFILSGTAISRMSKL